MNRSLVFIPAIAFVLAIAPGCSGLGNPVVDPGFAAEEGASQIPEQTHLWGYWDVFFDPVTGSMTAVPGRQALFTANVTGVGTVLVDSSGRTLYMLTADKGDHVTCTASPCTAVWPPVIAPSAPSAGAGRRRPDEGESEGGGALGALGRRPEERESEAVGEEPAAGRPEGDVGALREADTESLPVEPAVYAEAFSRLPRRAASRRWP